MKSRVTIRRRPGWGGIMGAVVQEDLMTPWQRRIRIGLILVATGAVVVFWVLNTVLEGSYHLVGGIATLAIALGAYFGPARELRRNARLKRIYRTQLEDW